MTPAVSIDEGGDTHRPTRERLASDVVLVIADRSDADAGALVSRLGSRAVLVTPRALSMPGWNWVPDPAARTGRSADTQFRGDQLGAVVTRLATVAPYQLGHVVPDDRDYVAAEMTAFLRAWLAGLPCPLFNPPHDLCLNGPAWNPEHWAMLATSLAVPTAPLHRHANGRPSLDTAIPVTPAARITVAGNQTVNHDGCAPVLLHHARTLAEAAATPLLAVDFDDTGPTGRLCTASCWPHLGHRDVLDALTDTLNIDRDQAARL
jgi:hypothetical protein